VCTELLVNAALEAGKIIRERFRTEGVEIRDRRAAADFVTNVDLMVQEKLCEMIAPAFPRAAVIAEEGGEIESAPQMIILDPLDGTLNYIHGYERVAVSVGYWKDGKPAAGVVYDPLAEDLFQAACGRGAFRNGRPIRASGYQTLGDCVLATGWPYDRGEYDRVFRILDGVARTCQEVRISGSAALNICYVACGSLDGYWEWDLNPWDMAGGAVIALEAGCAVTSLAGGPFQALGGEILVSNGHVHEEMLHTLREGGWSIG